MGACDWGDEPTGVRRVPERVIVEVEMSPEEYEKIRNNASWDYGGITIGAYLKWKALGGQRKGC